MTHPLKLYSAPVLSIVSPFDEPENRPKSPTGESHGVRSPSAAPHVMSRGTPTGHNPAELLPVSRGER